MRGSVIHYPFRLFVAALLLWALVPAPAFSATKKKSATKRTAAPAQPDKPVPRAVPIVEEVVPPAKGPDVLFIIVDDLNDWVGWLGGHPQSRTPNMDRLARMGMRFTNAHCAYALCNASRTSLLSGVQPWNSGVAGNEQDWRHSAQLIGKPTLPEQMQARGYFTAAAGKIFHASHGGPEGKLTGWHGGRRGFELDRAWNERFPTDGAQMPDLPVHTGQNKNGLGIWHWDWGTIDVSDDDMDDAKVVEAASKMLMQKTDRSKFVAVGLYHPHAPWYAPQKYFDQFPLDQIKLPDVKEDDLKDVPEVAKGYLRGNSLHAQVLDKKLWKDAVRAYLANIAFTDAMIGRLLDALEKSPRREQTIVCMTSDHGWYLGQKQRWHKGGLWEEATHVPLCIIAPGVTRPDSVCNTAVSLTDIYPTLVELAGVSKPMHLDGESLVPMLKDPAAKHAQAVITATGSDDKAGYAMRLETWRYIRYHNGSEELYDHKTDPHEWTNLASDASTAELRRVFSTKLPQSWNSPQRARDQLLVERAGDGSVIYSLAAGDELDGKAAPDIVGKAIDLHVEFDYRPAFDSNGTLIAQGGPQLGWAIHILDGKPCFTINYDGLHTTLKGSEELTAGHISLRGLFGLDGSLSLYALGLKDAVRGFAPMKDGFPRQPKEGLSVGTSFGPLNAKDFPNSAPFDGQISQAVLHVLPAAPEASGSR